MFFRIYSRPTSVSRVVLMLLWIFAPSFCAFAKNVDPSLKQAYAGKVFIIRHFWHGDHLQYDFAGQLIGERDPGYWTTDGVVRIEKIIAAGSTLRLECKRMVVRSGSQGLEYEDSRSKDKKRVINVQYGTASMSPDGIDSTLSKVFVSDKDDFVDSLAPYWKKCITTALNAVERARQGACRFSPQLRSLLWEKAGNSAASLLPASTPPRNKAEPKGIFNVSTRVTPPRAISAPDPQYTAEALAAHQEGTCVLTLIVDASGSPMRIEIVRPLGYGLDEQAVLTVQNWKFEPGAKDGKPVSVFATIETTFHLYK
jgi:TonB family protein